jgi:hypothetical protein
MCSSSSPCKVLAILDPSFILSIPMVQAPHVRSLPLVHRPKHLCRPFIIDHFDALDTCTFISQEICCTTHTNLTP